MAANQEEFEMATADELNIARQNRARRRSTWAQGETYQRVLTRSGEAMDNARVAMEDAVRAYNAMNLPDAAAPVAEAIRTALKKARGEIIERYT